MTDTLKPINTNELRDYADRISNPYSQLILDAASELDATRTERNILRAALTQPAAVEGGELRRLMAERDRMREALEAIVDNAEIDTDAVLFRSQAAAFARAAISAIRRG